MTPKYPPALLAARAEAHPPSPDEERLALAIARNTVNRWRHYGELCVERDDLLGEAYLAAWQALLTYDPERGHALTTWLIANCRRAVQEALRQNDPLTRLERTRHKAEQARYLAECALWQPGDAPPRPPLLPHPTVSLESIIHEDPDGYPDLVVADCLELPDQVPALLDRLEAERLAAIAWAALDDDPESAVCMADRREVVRLLFVEHLAWREATRRFGRSESRFSQLWVDARARMRAAVEAVR